MFLDKCKKKTFKDLRNVIEVRDRSEVRKVAGVKVAFFVNRGDVIQCIDKSSCSGIAFAVS